MGYKQDMSSRMIFGHDGHVGVSGTIYDANTIHYTHMCLIILTELLALFQNNRHLRVTA
jgi:hypothetical protein